jgi:hypothetical protein
VVAHAGRSNNHIDIERWLQDGDISESAVKEIYKLRGFPALFNDVAWKCNELSVKINDEITRPMVLKIIGGAIKCDYHAERSLNFETVPYELRTCWRIFDRNGCAKCGSPGKLTFQDETPGYRRFCVDHACYTEKLRHAREIKKERE